MMNKFARFTSLLLTFLFLLGTAQATSFVYNSQRRQIKAGVLVGPSWAASSLLFAEMEARLEFKPQGWEFYNPLAPASDKSLPAYWQVGLQNSHEDLAKFDVLFLGVKTPSDPGERFGFTREEREKLRGFVDHGGVLWIENTGGVTCNLENFVIPNIGFRNTGAALAAAITAPGHAVISRPFSLRWEDLMALGNGAAGPFNTGSSSGLPNDQFFATLVTDGTANHPLISAAQYGSGYVVMVSKAVSQSISDAEDLKLAYNIVNWGSEHSTFHKNARHSGSSYVETGMPLSTLWEFRTPMPGMTASSPAILDDMVFYVGDETLYAFDLSPTRDRDMDGDVDDGHVDTGASYDLLWSVDLGCIASSPTAAYVPVGGAAAPYVFVTTQQGKVLALNALTGSSSIPINLDSAFPNNVFDIPAPVYVEGMLLASGNNTAGKEGRLYGKNLILGGSQWASPVAPNSGPSVGSPSVGYVRDPITNTQDLLAFLPRRSLGTDIGGILPFPLKAYNEVLALNTPAGGGSPVYNTRSPGCAIRKTAGTYFVGYIAPNGQTRDLTINPNDLRIGNMSVNLATVPAGSTIVADYEVDPGTNIAHRQPIQVKTPTTALPEKKGVSCTPAIGPDGILYFSSEDGSLYAAQQMGRSSVRTIIKWRSYLGDLLRDATGNSLLAVPIGSPAVADDVVYFAANDANNGYIIALKANPEFSINLGVPIDRTKQIQVTQTDESNPAEFISANGIMEDANTAWYMPFVVDYAAGKIIFNNFRTGRAFGDNLKDFRSSSNIRLTCTTASGNIDQEFGGDKWNNLLWIQQLPAKVSSSPMITGKMLYIGCANGSLAAIDVDSTQHELTMSTPLSPAPILSTVAGSNGMLAVSTANGLSVLHSPKTLVADANRVMELDSAGKPIWTCDGTRSLTTTAREVSGSGPMVPAYSFTPVPFNHPAVARKAPVGGIMVADTGNNRVVLIDAGGRILWQITDFVDTGSINNPGYPSAPQLLSGSPLTLNNPTDVTMWVSTDSTGKPEYHFLIADSGNYRVLEIVARWNDTLNAYRNELDWTTRTFAQGKKYRYTSARPVFEPVGNSFVRTTMCVVTNFEVRQGGGVEGTGSALLRIDDKGEVIGVKTEVEEISNGTVQQKYTLRNPTFFSREYIGQDHYVDVITDAGGVYVVGSFKNGDWSRMNRTVRRYTAAQHNTLYGKPLAAVYAQYLPGGNILVTNKAVKLDNDPNKAFQGEVFTLEWKQANNQYEVGANPITSGLRQPSSAERQTN